MDLYVYNTCIEFKKDILRGGRIKSGDIKQLDGYIEQLVKAGSGVRNGILTDGVNYLIRHVGTDKLNRVCVSPTKYRGSAGGNFGGSD